MSKNVEKKMGNFQKNLYFSKILVYNLINEGIIYSVDIILLGLKYFVRLGPDPC